MTVQTQRLTPARTDIPGTATSVGSAGGRSSPVRSGENNARHRAAPSLPQYPMNQRDPPSHPSPRAPLSVFGYPLPEWEHVEL